MSTTKKSGTLCSTAPPVRWPDRMAKQPSARAQMLHDLCEQQAALRRSLALAELLKTIAVAANQATTVEDIYRCTLEQVCQQMGWPVGHVYVASPDESDGLTTSGIWYLGDAERFDVLRRTSETSRFAPGIGLPGRVLAEGRPVWIPDVLEDGNFPRGWAGEALGIRAGFAFPVQVSTDVVSVLEFFSPEVLPPDEQMLEVVGRSVPWWAGRWSTRGPMRPSVVPTTSCGKPTAT